MAAYLTPTEAEGRLLTRFGIEVDLLAGDLDVASSELDEQGPFKGTPYSPEQSRAFPRSFMLEDDVEGEVPDAILDWVSLAAHRFGAADSPGVLSESVGGASRTYARAKLSQAERYMSSLLGPYLNRAPIDIR
jgi:hypothetical protein